MGIIQMAARAQKLGVPQKQIDAAMAGMSKKDGPAAAMGRLGELIGAKLATPTKKKSTKAKVKSKKTAPPPPKKKAKAKKKPVDDDNTDIPDDHDHDDDDTDDDDDDDTDDEDEDEDEDAKSILATLARNQPAEVQATLKSVKTLKRAHADASFAAWQKTPRTIRPGDSTVDTIALLAGFKDADDLAVAHAKAREAVKKAGGKW